MRSLVFIAFISTLASPVFASECRSTYTFLPGAGLPACMNVDAPSGRNDDLLSLVGFNDCGADVTVRCDTARCSSYVDPTPSRQVIIPEDTPFVLDVPGPEGSLEWAIDDAVGVATWRPWTGYTCEPAGCAIEPGSNDRSPIGWMLGGLLVIGVGLRRVRS